MPLRARQPSFRWSQIRDIPTSSPKSSACQQRGQTGRDRPPVTLVVKWLVISTTAAISVFIQAAIPSPRCRLCRGPTARTQPRRLPPWVDFIPSPRSAAAIGMPVRVRFRRLSVQRFASIGPFAKPASSFTKYPAGSFSWSSVFSLPPSSLVAADAGPLNSDRCRFTGTRAQPAAILSLPRRVRQPSPACLRHALIRIIAVCAAFGGRSGNLNRTFLSLRHAPSHQHRAHATLQIIAAAPRSTFPLTSSPPAFQPVQGLFPRDSSGRMTRHRLAAEMRTCGSCFPPLFRGALGNFDWPFGCPSTISIS